jgi:two-component system, sensor histidine kinase and response regulator
MLQRSVFSLKPSVKSSRALLDGAPFGVCAFGGGGRIVYANPRFCALLGLPATRRGGFGGAAGLSFAGLLADPAADAATLRRVRDHRRLENVEVLLRRADGKRFWALLNAETRETERRRTYLLWVRDIHQRKEAQSALAAARDLAEAANAAKSTFLATIAHEIRTPMNGVVGMLELLERSPLDARQADIVAIIRESAGSLLGMVNDVLDYSRIEAGRMELEHVPVPLGALAENVCEMLAPAARRKGVLLTCHIAQDVPAAVYADPVRLRQVLFNLVGNAVKFTENGSVEVRLGVEASGEGWVRAAIEVTDSGIGIAPEALNRLFAPYTQAEASIARRFGGSGLGLSITRRLVDMMDGGIFVDSVVGRGSTFRIVAPFGVVPACVPDSLGRTPGAAGLRLDGLRVLVATATAAERAAALDYLRAAGATAQEVATPEAAVAACAAAVEGDGRRFDVVVMGADLYPQAVQAAPTLLGRRAGEAAPAVALLTEADSELTTRLLAGKIVGMTAVTRPVRRAVLLRAVAELAGISPDEAMKPAPPGRRPRILVADDNPVNRKVAARQLELLGYDVDAAADGETALGLYDGDVHDGVLTDVQMPGMDGKELARRLREMRAKSVGAAPLKIIAYTAAPLDDGPQDESVFDGRLEKPLSLERLAIYFGPVDIATALPPEAPPAEAPPASDACVVDLSALKALCGDDAALATEMLREFVAAAEEAATALTAAAAAEDLPELRAAAHNLRGSAQTAGAGDLARAARAVELAGRDGADSATLRRLSQDVADAVVAVSAFVADL